MEFFSSIDVPDCCLVTQEEKVAATRTTRRRLSCFIMQTKMDWGIERSRKKGNS
jgi:hypothetical protein